MPKICPMLLNMSKNCPKFYHILDIQHCEQNMCPNTKGNVDNMSKIHSRYVKNLDNCMALFCLTFEKWMCPKSQFGHLQSDLEIISKLQENVRNMTIICLTFGHIMDTWPATHRTTRATTLSFDSYFSLILLPLLYYSTTCVCSSDANVNNSSGFDNI